MDKTAEIIDKSVQLILEQAKQDIDAILLFGSHADGTAIWRSDIDICVVMRRNLTREEILDFKIKMTRKLPEIVDFNIFQTLPLKVKKSIADNHQVLFESPRFDDFNFSKRQRVLFEGQRREKELLGVA